ncbi:MAG: polyprenyl synthetase family protein, partial [Bacteroidaceae bacterium]|nr:polyprenyl synthetase family protein [Bacteroidaceae bacterium]
MNQLDNIKLPIQSELATFHQLYDEAMKSDNALLNQVLLHLRKSVGKQMRPILTLLIARLFGEINRKTYDAAISLELLHTASLVHDDVVDESDKRRGALSVNAAFNNKVAVLSGDYLLSTSLLYVAKTDIQSVEIVSSLGQQLSRGELLQLFNTTA